jgi:hypothetical protein
MTDIGAMFDAYPAPLDGVDVDILIPCVQECVDCAQTCTACADACLADPGNADLGRVCATALVCADMCATTARTLVRRAGHHAPVTRAVLLACIETCDACYDECRRHALQHEHCRICADSCHRCARACRTLQTRLR